MSYVSKIAAGWAAFVGTHMIMSHPGNREAIIDKLGGEQPFLGAYSLVALGTFLPTTYYYNKYLRDVRKGLIKPQIAFTPSKFTKGLGVFLTGAYFFIAPQVMSSPSPSAQNGNKSEAQDVRGLLRVTRHPLFASLGVLGIGRCLSLGTVPALVYWGGMPLFFLIGTWHQDYRQRSVFSQRYFENTSQVPFVAIAQGKQKLGDVYNELNPNMLFIGALLVCAFLVMRGNRARNLLASKNIL
ncbi:3 TM domain-containing transmembrane protein [Acrasis kona]|uniref:3 TM domain-containing transmembrane protein n=1 Tax=Acrasis kona TaxID=1008807 RepID=A0AAW2ZMR3_9EUKA